MHTKLVIIGAGGFGREVMDVVEDVNLELAMIGRTIEVLGFLDDGDPDPAPLAAYDVAHIGPVAALDDMPPDVEYVIGIGSPQARATIDRQFAATRHSPALVHPSATRGRAVELGPGSVVCAGVRLTNNIRIGRHVHINLNTTVGHDATVGDHSTLSPLCAVSGKVDLAERVFLGTGVSINPGVSLGADSIVGSGAAVLRDVPAGVTVVGVPAKAT